MPYVHLKEVRKEKFVLIFDKAWYPKYENELAIGHVVATFLHFLDNMSTKQISDINAMGLVWDQKILYPWDTPGVPGA